MCRYGEYSYYKCHYAECRHAECRGAVINTSHTISLDNKFFISINVNFSIMPQNDLHYLNYKDQHFPGFDETR